MSNLAKSYSPPGPLAFARVRHQKERINGRQARRAYSTEPQTPKWSKGRGTAENESGCIDVASPSGFPAALLVAALAFISGAAGYSQNYTLAEALNCPSLPWTADSTDDTFWFIQTAVTHDGVAAVECVPHIEGCGATLHTTVTGPGSLTFWFRFGSGPPLGTDVEVAQQKQGEPARRVLYGGSTYWTQGGMTIGEGVYDVQWGCAVKSTPQAVFLDEIQFTPSVRVKIDMLAIVNGQAQIKFSAPTNRAASLRLLSAVSLTGPWSTNTAAVLSTNALGGSFTFTAPVTGSPAQFYRVQSSAGN